MSNLIYAIVLNWNNAPDTIECIESLKKTGSIDFKILCVDNGSEDKSCGKIREAHPDIEFLETGANLGYAGGNNAGIKYAMEKGAGYFWILNNDTVADANALKPMIESLKGDSTAGAAGSVIMRYDNKHIIWFAGGIYDRKRGYTSHYLENRSIEEVKPATVPEKFDFVSGASFVVTRKAIEKTGYLDSGLFLFYEEIDYCFRLNKAGFKYLMCPGSIVYHKVSASLGDDSPLKLYYYTRNRLYISKKYFPRYFTLVLLWCIRWPLLPSFVKKRKRIPYVLAAFRDFFAGRRGALNERKKT
ncbi:MAG TPA: glycosyltransferase family 2 protein [bacterium]|nr:glycosyltransferase family 2 protein [bacterium]